MLIKSFNIALFVFVLTEIEITKAQIVALFIDVQLSAAVNQQMREWISSVVNCSIRKKVHIAH